MEPQQIQITAETSFVRQQSNPSKARFVYFYTITIKNDSTTSCKLISRHWLIKDANNKLEEVYGEGVIGEQPIIEPGSSYQYSSGAVLKTEMGTMEGRYFMVWLNSESGNTEEFEVSIPKFVLSVPRTLH
jgi:ApaG protein